MRLRNLPNPDHLPALNMTLTGRAPAAAFGALDSPPRILLLYGSLRTRSFFRLAVEEAARLLQYFGAQTRQRHTRLHVRSHVGLLGIAWQRRDGRELAGQLVRIAAAALFSRVWIPEGNAGGANVSATQPMPIPTDLQIILDADRPK